jgi:hypothetical protein
MSQLPGAGDSKWSGTPGLGMDDIAQELVTGIEVRRKKDGMELLVTKQLFAVCDGQLVAVGEPVTTAMPVRAGR